ncbi:MAG TPA: DUF932 domain-containing protein [Ignavibacteria bacterium]|nr:DUF932 domain-containing protein [Ignavibacteria bacterium]HMR41384.1 DUF932 domain-containing protein [Ignavibacteria bacterium]
MKRITNLNDVSFPVNLKPVFIQNNEFSKLKGFKVVIGEPDKKEKIFSVVSDKYSLVTNTEAYELGKSIFREYFGSSNSNNLSLFNVTFPTTKSFCNIDIVNRDYAFNIWGLETYFPFMRITNSYNRTKSLRFEIGFIRKWCDNGVIFEKETIHFNFTHFKRSVDKILTDIKKSDKQEKLITLEKQFTDIMNKLKDTKIEKDQYVPLTAKILSLNFDINSEDIKKRNIEINRKNEFVKHCESLRTDYSHLMSDNAYSAFNVATDFINNRDFIKSYRYNDYQIKAGKWLKEFASRKNKETLEEYLKDYAYLMNNN